MDGSVPAVRPAGRTWSCDEASPWLPLYADGELAPDDASRVEAHLAACPDCRVILAAHARLRDTLRHAAVRQEAQGVPPAFEAALRRELAAEADRRAPRRALGLVLAVALVLVAGVFVRAWLVRAPSAHPLLERTLAQHVLDVPLDIASPDASRVARFVGERVGGVPRVPQLDALGYVLGGARVIHVDDQPAAQLVYRGGLGGRLSVVMHRAPRAMRQAGLSLPFAMRPGAPWATASVAPALLGHAQRGALAAQVLQRDDWLYAVVGEAEVLAATDWPPLLGPPGAP